MTRSARWGLALLFFALFYTLYTLVFGEGGLRDIFSRQALIEEQQQEKRRQAERNRALGEQIESLRAHGHAIEELARENLGMVREGEIFYQIGPEGEDDKKGSGEKTRDDPSSVDEPWPQP